MTKFTRTDIFKDGIVNEENLDILCKQINDMSCYDKVGPEFYAIDSSMSFTDNDRSPHIVSTWLNHLGSLRVTAGNVGYTYITDEMKIDELVSYDIENIKNDIAYGDASYLADVLSGNGFTGYYQLTSSQLDTEYNEMLSTISDDQLTF